MKVIRTQFLSVVLAVCTLPFVVARADGYGKDYDLFQKIVSEFVKSCPNMDCGSDQLELVYQRGNKILLSPQVLESLAHVAWQQAQIWGDTILEGDYHADGNTQLDAVYTLIHQSEVVGYRIVYSEKAWDTATCAYANEENMDQCQVGRIVEASFVSLTLKSFTVDQNQFAEFHAQD